MTVKDLFVFFSHASSLSVVAPIILCLFQYQKLNTQYKLLLFYLFVCGLSDAICLTLLNLKWNLKPVINTFTIIEFCSISAIYYLVFAELRIKKTLIVLTIVLIIVALYQFIINDGFFKIDIIVSSTEALFTIVLSALTVSYFFKTYRKTPLLKYHFFWITIAFLLYFQINLFIFLSGYVQLSASENDRHIIKIVSLGGNILKNVLFAIGIYKIK